MNFSTFSCYALLLTLYISGAIAHTVLHPTNEADADFFSAYRNITFLIEHSFGGVFTHRSTIQVTRKSDGKQTLLFTGNNGVYGVNHSLALKDLLSSNDLYKIRIRSQDGNYISRPVTSSLPACLLQQSGFKEDLLVYLSSNNSIIGVTYSSPTTALARECDPSKIQENVNFQTRVKVADPVYAQTVPVQALGPRPGFLQDVKLGPKEVDGLGDRPPQNSISSFIRRYWYIIVIMGIYMMLGGGPEPQKAEGGGERNTAPAAKSS